MRRTALLVAALVLLSGCAAPYASTAEDVAGEESSSAGASSGPGTGSPGETATPIVHDEDSDPGNDRLGWENGYWSDDPIPVNATNGLNASEREAVVSRAMARVEVIRDLEFETTVNVTVVSRSNFSAGGGGNESEAFRRFDNAKFEALYLIGNQEDSIETQDETRNQTVAGYYSPSRKAIVIVSDSKTPKLNGPRTLAHELVHALQDQHFNLSSSTPRTRDAYNGRNGLVEGDARTVELAYMDRCGTNWSCLPEVQSESSGDGSGSGPSINLGVYILSYFPYSDGPGFIAHLRDGDDWSRVNDAFAAPPTSSTAVISPEKYGSFDPAEVDLHDRTRNGWERVRPDSRPDYAVLGQSALTAMFAYTLYDDYNRSAVVEPREFLNVEGGGVNRTDPFNYSLTSTRGWRGDRLHVYERDGEMAYVWRLTWKSSADAEQFAERYRVLLEHWGGERVDDGVWVLAEDSPFADAVSLTVEGDTVTIVNAPRRGGLDDVYRSAG